MASADVGLWARWAVRDARRRAVLVTVLAVIIAIGTGAYAALSSTGRWRRLSNNASYQLLAAHDIKVTLREGATLPEGSLRRLMSSIPSASRVIGIEERLVVDTQLELNNDGRQIRVPGRIVGAPIDARIDRLSVKRGQGLSGLGATQNAVLEAKFAAFHGLPASGRLQVSGGHTVRYVGTGVTPEYFTVYGSGDAYANQSSFAVLFTSTATAQRLAAMPMGVNDAVVRVAPGSDVRRMRSEIAAALVASRPGTVADITLLTEERSYRLLYDDIETDKQWWNVFAGLVLLGAAIATFNLTSRIVESQRREIGIGMALGVTPSRLALRPMLVGLQVAMLGAVLGVGMGLLIGASMRGFMSQALPLPVWRTPFQGATYLRAAALGMALPVVASALPVWRAVHTTPTMALRSGALAPTERGRYLRMARGVRLPGSVTAALPLRSLVRTPRRTLLTALGIGASIATLVAVLGMLDTFFFTIDQGSKGMVGEGARHGLTVSLRRPVPITAPELRAISELEGVARSEAALAVPGRVTNRKAAFDLSLETVDQRGGLWKPLLVRGGGVERSTSTPGIILSTVAARELHAKVGSVVVLTHPARAGVGYRTVETRVLVDGVHKNPLRAAAFVDQRWLTTLGLDGLANRVRVVAMAGRENEVEAAMFRQASVASIRTSGATSRMYRDAVDRFVGIFRVIEGFVLLLAVLIAFNTASISTDERTRENATLYAFGVRPRSVLRMGVVEGLAIGVLGTAIGLALGDRILRWITTNLARRTIPDIGLLIHVSASTVISVAAVGIVAVSLAPVLTFARLRNLDVPAALRYVE